MGTLCGAGPLVAVLLCLLVVFAVGEEELVVPNPVVVDTTSAPPVSGPTPSLDVIPCLSVSCPLDHFRAIRSGLSVADGTCCSFLCGAGSTG